MKRIGKVWAEIIRFTEKQGFPIMVTLCVAIITATALWTGRNDASETAPPPAETGHVSAAQLMQQSLKDATTPTPAPTAAALTWQTPIEGASLLRGFDANRMVQGGVTGLWAIHDAVDLAATEGQTVRAMANGVVCGMGEDRLRGGWVRIEHADGYAAEYSGVKATQNITIGRQIAMGQPIGTLADGPLDEQDLGPHLHLRVTKDGLAVDPTVLLEPF